MAWSRITGTVTARRPDGTGSYLRVNAALRRLRVGPFLEHHAKALDKLREPEDTAPASPDLLLPVATALADIPALALTEQEAADLRHGQAISLVALMGRIPATADPAGGLARAMAGGRVIGLCRCKEGILRLEGALSTARVLFPLTQEMPDVAIGGASDDAHR